MCLFAKDLPLALTLRVWDVFFVYGDHALFAVGLVMMQMGEARVLSCRTLEEVYDELKAMGTGLQQRDAEAAHRLVTASLEALMNTALIDLIETTRLESRAQLLREAEEAAADAAATAATEAADAAAHAADAPPSPLPPLTPPLLATTPGGGFTTPPRPTPPPTPPPLSPATPERPRATEAEATAAADAADAAVPTTTEVPTAATQDVPRRPTMTESARLRTF